MTDPAQIYEQAATAARTAAEKHNASLPPENQRGLDCGFAWVMIKPARGAFVAYCKAAKHGATIDYGGGFQIWYSEFDPTPTQSISVHVAAAKAFSEVLKQHGINASWSSRLD